GWYARACREACAGIHARHRVPILVGGSGLYLRAVQEGLAGEPPKDPAVRARIAAELEAFGPEALHARLAALDPGTAARLGPRDRQRIMRALEVVHASGKPLSWWHERQERAPADEHWTVLELVIPAAMLRERIRSRTHAMFEHGLIEETRTLVARGFEPALRALRAIGYDEALELLAGRLTRGDAEAATRRRTTQLAKRQRTWFRHQVQTVRLDGAKGDLESLCEAAAAAAIAGARLEGRGGIDTGSARL
ncbi:MAG TPA: tRNA (adenosine(37)-N6)-dimethylallyltransferase MiaA, partial [Candidatus Limnocylindria bacterium]|nr:tRNA (adenosine(37)-N6)-dimethylallyltransferase MiaA [Candidatus Limnocylindria bacterium]